MRRSGLSINILAVLITAQIVLSSFGEALAQVPQFTKTDGSNGSTHYSTTIQSKTALALKNSVVTATHGVNAHDPNNTLTKLYNAPNWAAFENQFNDEAVKEARSSSPSSLFPKQPGFLNQHMIFCTAMAVNQLFFAATSGDRLMFNEWVNSMTSLEFHTSMFAFTIAMSGYNKTLDALFDTRYPVPDKVWQARMRHLALPLGNYVSSVYSEVYTNPILQEIFATMNPKHQVTDPDNPSAKPTQDKEIRAKVRRNLQLKLLKDLWVRFSDGEGQFNKIFASAQLGLVTYVIGKVKSKIIAPGYQSAKTAGKRFLITFVNKTATGVELTLEKFLPTEIVDSIVGGAEVAYLSTSEALAKWFAAIALRSGEVGLSMVAQKVAQFAGGVWGLVVFFVGNGIFTYGVDPVKTSNQRIRNVDQSLTQLDSAVNWYLKRKPGEEIPWSQMDVTSRKWKWIKFFLSNDAAKLKTDEKLYTDFWETIKPPPTNAYGYSRGLPPEWKNKWDDIEETVAWFTETFLGHFENEITYSKCGSDLNCQRDWVLGQAADFQTTLKHFKGEMYLRAGVAHVSENFTQYRDQVIFKDVLAKQQEWSQKVNQDLTDKENKERYFNWIARGMSLNDHYFIENSGFWHSDLDSAGPLSLLSTTLNDAFAGNFFISEQRDRVAAFDAEVLKCNFLEYNNWCALEYQKHPELYTVLKGRENDLMASPQFSARIILSNHAAIFKRFLEIHRNEVNATSLKSLIDYQYPSASDPTPTKLDIEYNRVRKLVLFNPFEQEQSNADKQELGVLVRWLLQGMPASAEYLARANKAWPVGQNKEIFGRESLCSRITYPFLSLRPQPAVGDGQELSCLFLGDPSYEAADLNLKDFHKEMADKTGQLMGLLYGLPGHSLDDSTRDLIIAEKYTYDELKRQEKELNNTIADLNIEFSQVLTGEIYPGKGMNREYFVNLGNQFLQKHVSPNLLIFPQDKDIFTEGGQDKARTWHFMQFIGDTYNAVVNPSQNQNEFGKYANVPAGGLNNFDFELQTYLSFMNQYAYGIKLNEIYESKPHVDGPGKKAVVDQAVNVAVNVSTDLTLLEMIWPRTDSANAEFKSQDQSAFKNLYTTAYQSSVMLENLIATGAICDTPEVKEAYDSVKDCLSATPQARRENLSFAKLLDSNDKRVSRKIFADWAGVKANDAASKDMAKGFDKIQRLRNSSLDVLRTNLQSLTDKLRAHGTAPAKMSDETMVPAELQSKNFIAPLLTATTGSNTAVMNLLQIFGQQVVQTENQKLIQARMACFMLGDEICSPHK